MSRIGHGARLTVGLASGYVPQSGGQTSGRWSRFRIRSGDNHNPPPPTAYACGSISVGTCRRCQRSLGAWNYVYVAAASGNLSPSYWCRECANYKDGYFRTDAGIINEFLRSATSQSLDPTEVPDYALADWYDDKGLPLIAEYLRSNKDEQVQNSR